MIEINRTVLNIAFEAFEAYIASICEELETAEDNEERKIFESQIHTARIIRGMFCDLKPGETIKLIDGGPDATIMPYIKRVEESND